jgi:hypothetical protein
LGLLQVTGRAEFRSFTSLLMVNFYRELECMGKVGKLAKYLEKLAWKLAGRAVEA